MSTCSQIRWHRGWGLKGKQQNQSSLRKRGFESVSITHQWPEEANPNSRNPLRRPYPSFLTTWRRPTSMSPPHLPLSTSHCKKFSSNTFTCVIHLGQNSALKQHHGSILCSPGGPWGPGCPAGPGNPGGPSPGAPGGPCKPWRPGRPGSPAGRQEKHRRSILWCCLTSCLLKMPDKVLWKHMAKETSFSHQLLQAWAWMKGCSLLLAFATGG